MCDNSQSGQQQSYGAPQGGLGYRQMAPSMLPPGYNQMDPQKMPGSMEPQKRPDLYGNPMPLGGGAQPWSGGAPLGVQMLPGGGSSMPFGDQPTQYPSSIPQYPQGYLGSSVPPAQGPTNGQPPQQGGLMQPRWMQDMPAWMRQGR